MLDPDSEQGRRFFYKAVEVYDATTNRNDFAKMLKELCPEATDDECVVVWQAIDAYIETGDEITRLNPI